MEKDKFLAELSAEIDRILSIDPDAEIEYFSMTFKNYNPKPESKLSWFEAEISLDKNQLKTIDRSEPFKGCDPHCTNRGYCNGDC